MDKVYYVIYDEENDIYMERTDWGDGEIDEEGFSHPDMVVNYSNTQDAINAKNLYSNADKLKVVKVTVTYEFEDVE